MQELRLVAVSEDGSYLVLATAGRGTRFTLPVDDRLRAAVRGHFSRLGQYEIEVESPLRPKEIQARIRAGETAEEIAETAGIPVERVRWFEGPVLQEREYMAQQAQRVTIRRQGESAPAPALGEIVEERLGKRGIDLEEVEWDSRKCEDSTWRVRLSFSYDGRPYAAEWAYDPRRRNISAVNEEASRLSSLDLDDAVDDTVTPFLPRRAMKVVGDPAREDRRASRDSGEASVQELPKAEPARTEPPLRAEPAKPDPKIAEREAAEKAAAEREKAEREAAARAEAEREAAEKAEREAAERAVAQREALELAERQQAAAEAAREAALREAEKRETEERETEERETEEREKAEREKAEREKSEREKSEREKSEREKTERRQAAEREAAARAAAERAAAERAKPAAAEPVRQPAKPTPKPAPPKPAEPAEQPAAAATPKPAPPPAQEKRPAARKKARGKRASVPSWDEIMFGARRPE